MSPGTLTPEAGIVAAACLLLMALVFTPANRERLSLCAFGPPAVAAAAAAAAATAAATAAVAAAAATAAAVATVPSMTAVLPSRKPMAF